MSAPIILIPDDGNPTPEALPKRILVEHVEVGYAHTRMSGRCAPDVTVKEIEEKFYHSYFGGRDAWVDGKGHWGCVRHDD